MHDPSVLCESWKRAGRIREAFGNLAEPPVRLGGFERGQDLVRHDQIRGGQSA